MLILNILLYVSFMAHGSDVSPDALFTGVTDPVLLLPPPPPISANLFTTHNCCSFIVLEGNI